MIFLGSKRGETFASKLKHRIYKISKCFKMNSNENNSWHKNDQHKNKLGCVKLTLNALTEDRDREIDEG